MWIFFFTCLKPQRSGGSGSSLVSQAAGLPWFNARKHECMVTTGIHKGDKLRMKNDFPSYLITTHNLRVAKSTWTTSVHLYSGLFLPAFGPTPSR